MRALWVLVAVGGLFCLPAVAQDQPAGPPLKTITSPIVTLDRDRLFQSSRMGIATRARFEAASNDLVTENRQLEAALEDEERTLTERRKAVEPDAFRLLADEFDKRVEDLRKAQDAKSRALTRSRDADQQAFFQAALPVLGQLMVEIEAVAIIDRSAVIVSFDQLDITDMAIARLDATLGDGPEPSAVPTQPTPDPVPEPDIPAVPPIQP